MAGPADIESIFRLVNREAWIVTAAHGVRRGGLVATWVARSTLDPAMPMVAVNLNPGHFTTELVAASGSFALHLIDEKQLDLAWTFCLGSGRDTDKLAAVPHRRGTADSPILTDCLAWLECRVAARYDAGDRVLFWADVIDGAKLREGSPLTERTLFAAAGPERLARLKADLAADIETGRPRLAAWRASLESA
jgi:flavin reductase (DIM6/NTAB) family NADH-FMN oxidoreductase RutF